MTRLKPGGREIDVYEVNFHTTGGNANAGQRNAVVVNVSDTTATDKEVDISKLVVSVTSAPPVNSSSVTTVVGVATGIFLPAFAPGYAGASLSATF